MPESLNNDNDQEVSFLLQKTFECACCGQQFKNYVIKSGKTRQKGQDIDLRPHCYDIDPLKYGAIVCPSCGYAALNGNFGRLTPNQIKMIKEKVTPSFSGIDDSQGAISYDEAINRHKLALVNAIHGYYKTSDKAYLFLLIGWLRREQLNQYKERVYRQIKGDNIGEVDDAFVIEMEQEVNAYLKKASEGFKTAFTKENMPICGMDQNTITYLVAALDYETGNYEESLRWVSRLITSGGTADRIKQRGRDLRDMVKKCIDDAAKE